MRWRSLPSLFHPSPSGISLKTQQLYALVFITRYLDLLTTFISLYNSVMKLVFLGTTFSIVHYMTRHRAVKQTYDREHDSFRYEFIVGPCAVLALILHSQFTFIEVRRAPIGAPVLPITQLTEGQHSGHSDCSPHNLRAVSPRPSLDRSSGPSQSTWRP